MPAAVGAVVGGVAYLGGSPGIYLSGKALVLVPASPGFLSNTNQH